MVATRKPVKLSRVPLNTLVPHPKNPNQHPVVQLDALVASVKRYGQPRPILVRAANRMICGGHGIAEAMRLAGEADADVLLWDVDQKTADEYLVADNRLGALSKIDDERLRALLADIDTEALPAIGYSAEEVDQLLGDAEDPELLIKEVDTSDVRDTFWIVTTGPLAHQARALRKLQELMAELPEVEVELGTTPQ